jgi:hypothetical protein
MVDLVFILGGTCILFILHVTYLSAHLNLEKLKPEQSSCRRLGEVVGRED